jgi:cytochrome c2
MPWPGNGESSGGVALPGAGTERRKVSQFGKIAIALALLVMAGVAAYAGWEIRARALQRAEASRFTGGDPSRGPALMVRYGCAGCHTVPGVPGAGGLVGPPLRDVARRVYLGGVVTNTPANMVQWIVNPREADPKTAMPITGISPAEARHVAAYLYSLR